MISLHVLTDHTMTSYCTYITAYSDFVANTLHVQPSEVGYPDIIRFLDSLKEERGLSDRTINWAISQIRFFTMYVLHKPWDPTQVPMRRFDTYLPYVPSQDETRQFISTMTDIKQKAMVALMYSSGLRIGEVCRLRYEDIQRRNMRIHIAHGKNRSDRYALLSSAALDILTQYWFTCGRPTGWLFPKQTAPPVPSAPSSCRGISGDTKRNSDGPGGSPAIPPCFWHASLRERHRSHDNKDPDGAQIPDLHGNLLWQALIYGKYFYKIRMNSRFLRRLSFLSNYNEFRITVTADINTPIGPSMPNLKPPE